ncbi:hypothetical protein K458DRAFT_417459 [Lentithecium fluviatile CBS 122367]|uniref:BRCT domain-containing protein n=1 Tax=Lentithecium fluviatile CBS 122367 TaxID=1168545 RepID=A0A6G1J5B8_9PLEO|nr:hypothetical protein K458DRAFT_417459 [Lentithecium fluviatile CBS 122367]
MYQTFDGVMDAPGDTQPDSQMFRQYTSGLVESNRELASNLGVPHDMGANAPTDDCEMVESSQSQPSNTITSPTVMHDDPETQFRDNEPLTSPLKFETPAIAGRKRNSQGQALSSAMKTNTTPGTVLSASAFFGFGNGGNGNNSMSLTQAFNATQARTSPVVEETTEDFVFQRPSPNFVNARQRHSSPPVALSSPIKDAARTYPATDSILRSSSEPRADYETLKQSQERRKLELRHEDTWTSVVTQDCWEEPTAVQKRYDKRRAKEKLDQEAALALANVSAPTPSVRRVKKRGLLSMTANYRLPQMSRARAPATLDDPTNADANDDSPDELSQTVPVTVDQEEDSPDELSQDISVPSSARASRERPLVNEEGAGDRVQVPNTSSHPQHLRTLSGQSARNLSQPDTPSSQLQRESQFRAFASQPLHRSIAKLKSSREPEVIMDSQPEENSDTPRPPKALRFPSSPSTNQYSINQTVLQNQSGLTSPVVSSSMPPMPPRSSSPERAETRKAGLPEDATEGVPSSPPIVPQDEITYDEHAYEDNSEDDQESKDTHSNPEDVDPKDEDDLPVAKAERNGRAEPEVDAPIKEADQDPNVEERISGDMKMGSDDEIPETIEEELPELHNEEEELIRSIHPEGDLDDVARLPMAPPRVQRQSTVPETDMLDETQPFFFPEPTTTPQLEDHAEDAAPKADDGLADTNSTSAFHTGKEQQSASQSATVPNGTAEEGATLRPLAGPEVRSLLDIANQPDTQRSADLDVIDMPQLSFAAELEDTIDAIMTATSPVRPTKRHKVTYRAKKKSYRSPVGETDPPSEHAPSSTLKRGANQRSWTPPFAPTQESASQRMLAEARVRVEEIFAQAATLKSKPRVKSTQPRTPRSGTLKPVDKTLLARSPGTPKPSLREANVEEAPPTRSVEAANADITMHDADADDSEADELAGPPPQVAKKQPVVKTATDDGEPPTGELLTPNRILAAWPGGHFYPATCLCRYDAKRYQIRYDYDGAIHEVASTNIRAFDLRPGDHVKLDIKGMKKQSYVVVGFKNKIDMVNLTTEYPTTDQRGYATMVVEEKERESLPAAKNGHPRKRFEVQMSTVYLTKTLWARFRDRLYKHTSTNTPVPSASPVGTPSSGPDVAPTPTYRRRSTVGPSFLREPTARVPSVVSSLPANGAIFDNMIFAVTLTNKSSDRDAIIELITSNGGEIVEDGFHDMFIVESAKPPPSSDSTLVFSSGLDGLVMYREYENLGFAALITDSHSRRTKHFQALALNLPILHFRWIQDSVSASRPVPFAKHLLPAGVSTYLDPEGVIRSRTMETYDPADENVNFLSTIKERDLLLRNQAVILVTNAGKRELELMHAYLFLTHALGPKDVGRCKDLFAAKEIIKTGQFDWVFVKDGPAGVAEAAEILFGDTSGDTVVVKKKGPGRKRKRDDGSEPELLVRSGFIAGKKIRVACDEFVIQSLILGALIEE